MSKKPHKKKKKMATHQTPSVPAKKNVKYSPGEIAMAVLGAALVIMTGVIIITSFLE